jgi:putative membrane protein insertion efficiency factor
MAISGVRFYQRGISPLLGPRCRYTPSCSQYMILAIQKYGLIRGVLRGAWRIARCNPFSHGGHDPP